MYGLRPIFMIFLLNASVCCGRILKNVLKTYDTLNRRDIRHHIIRRSLDYDLHERFIHFNSHEKQFHVKLVQSKEIFHPSFEAVSVDRYGNKTQVFVDTDYFYNGHLVNDPSALVTAHLEEDGMLTATIETEKDTYVVEPMWRHVESNTSPLHDMIVYKASELLFNNSLHGGAKVCGNTGVYPYQLHTHGERVRRSNKNCRKYRSEKNTCQLKLIGDYKFYKNIGREHEQTAIYQMVQVINRVNNIYRDTCWDNVGNGIGVQVKSIEVLKEETSEKYSFNSDYDWSIDNLLTEFSRTDWTGYCLAHLFTHQDFKHGVIGLAYVASKNSKVGGICSNPGRDGKGPRYHNCGLTTYKNWGRTLTTLEATLVTAHEIGHNFGANHDRIDATCAPKRARNDDLGNYLMYETSVTGERRNNQKFSRCSRSSVGEVLASRAKDCLKEPGGRCGNGVIDDKEQCDRGRRVDDRCCTDNCKLRAHAECSDYNHMCCNNCTVRPRGAVCKDSFPLECEGVTRCDGENKTCPAKAEKLTSGECYLKGSFRKGSCNVNGNCTGLCELHNLVSCLCPPGESSCRVCCKSADRRSCEPLTILPKNQRIENDGVHCRFSSYDPDDNGSGICDQGLCVSVQRRITEIPGFADLFNNFSIEVAVRFMRHNIVLTILIFSLLLWIPAACIVHRVDKYEEDRVFKFEREMSKDQFIANVARMNAAGAMEGRGDRMRRKGKGARVRTGHYVG